MSDIPSTCSVGGNAVVCGPSRTTLPAWLLDSPALPAAPEPVVVDWISVDSPKFTEPEATITVAEDAPSFTCDRCDSHEYRDTTIHDGQSVRRDCAVCGRTEGFPIWWGQQ